MNGAIVAMRDRGLRFGSMARLAGAPPIEQADRRAELDQLLAERSAAMTASDADGVALAEHRIDELFDEVRAGRDRQRNPDGTFASPDSAADNGFDGGRSLRPVAPPAGGAQEEDAASLMARAMLRSRQERDESGSEDRLVGGNI
jgi:hypothetical protein